MRLATRGAWRGSRPFDLVRRANQEHPPQLCHRLQTLQEAGCYAGMAGAGAGWMKDEFEPLGVPFEDRGRLTDEYLAAACSPTPPPTWPPPFRRSVIIRRARERDT
jgi:hypothetical protein